jgi:integrase
MRKPNSLANWDASVAAYLINRRALGRIYKRVERVLRNLRKDLIAADVSDLTMPLFEQWRGKFRHLSATSRSEYERTVYNFCRYRRRSQPHCFLPDPLSLTRGKPARLPVILEPRDVARMLMLATKVKPARSSPLRPAVVRLAIVLLYTAGLRRGELSRLALGDVDAKAGVLRIRESKFHKSRWVPLSPSARRELQCYLKARLATQFDARSTAPLFCTRATRAYSVGGMDNCLIGFFKEANICNAEGRRPKLSEFRHSFAVGALLRWYETDADVQVSLPRLAMYMGHVSIVSTAYYLRWMPAVIARASKRFERTCASVVNGGAL